LPADLVDNNSAHVCTPGFPKKWQARLTHLRKLPRQVRSSNPEFSNYVLSTHRVNLS